MYLVYLLVRRMLKIMQYPWIFCLKCMIQLDAITVVILQDACRLKMKACN